MKRLSLTFALIVLILATLLAGRQITDTRAIGGPQKSANVAPEVMEALHDAPAVSVIVTLGTKPRLWRSAGSIDVKALADRVAASQARVLADLPQGEFALARQYKVVPALAGDATPAGVWALAAHPDVVHVGLNRQVHADLAQAVPLINADDVHALLGITGAGVVAAVLDTGIDTDHPMLSDDLIHQECFLDSGTCPGGGTTGSSAEDGHGHGTHVSGIITSSGPPIGVAPDAEIEAFKVLDDGGSGSFANVLSAYDHIILSHPEVDLINMSLGDGGSYAPGSCEGFIPAMTTAVATTRAMGITTFAASGNNGSKSGIGYPACINDIVSVGAVYDADIGPQAWGICTDPATAPDLPTCFSQSNLSLDLLAPGSTITSTVPGGGLDTFSGTSMASPAAAAVAALLLDSEPTLSPADVETRLTDTGVPIVDPGNGVTTCRVDAYEAVINDGGPVCASSGPPPPANDNFADTFVIAEPLPYTNTQLTIGATQEVGEPQPCGGIASTVWYSFTPTTDQALVADTIGSTYDPVLAVYTGPSLGSLTLVGCNDDYYGLQSRVQFTATAGVTYHFQVGGYFGSSGSLTINVNALVIPTCPSSPTFSWSVADPLGDAFGSGLPSHDITNVSAQGDASTLCLAVDFAGPVDPADAGTGQEVVGLIEFDTDQNSATGGSPFMDIFCLAPSGMGVEAALNMFSVSGGFGFLNGSPVPVVFDTSSFTAIIPFSLIGGENAFNVGMVLGSIGEPTDCAPGSGGCIESPAGTLCPGGPPSKPNDNFADRIVIPQPLPYTNTQSTIGMTLEPGEPQPCVGIGDTVWYSFTPKVGMLLTADTIGSGYDTALAAYTGASLASLVNIGCNDDAVGLQSRLIFTASAGVTYHFQMGGFFGSSGSLTTNLSGTPCPDQDGDGICDSVDPDIDGDGCTNVAEQQTAVGSELSGGRRDYLNPNDYFNPSGDLKNRIDDVLLVVEAYFKDDNDGNPGLPPYAPGYTPNTDRTLKGPDNWRTGPPNGLQRVDDILNQVHQYFHDCL